MCQYYDPPELWAEGQRTAVKQHRCGECGRTIEPSETYTQMRARAEGRWYGGKECAQCHEARRWLVEVCDGWLLTDVLNDLECHLDEPKPIWSVSLGRLVIRMRKRWRRKDGSLWPAEDIRAVANKAIAATRSGAGETAR